jgi:hypothetical protein
VVLNDATAKWVVGYKSTFAFNLNFGGAAQTVDICGHRYVYPISYSRGMSTTKPKHHPSTLAL